MTEAYDKLKRLLDELFQFDRADLDFGIYRIMNHKREEVSSFLDNDLLPQVRDAFAKYLASDTTLMRQRLEELERQAQSLNISPTTIPEYGETQALIEQGADISALEEEVYSDLYTFFRRYYKNGDFVSLRRYKEGTYAIPYEGEEVKLHWANADQYYVKTTESFRDYRFRLPDDRYVHFRLVAASTERDNNKAQNGKERRFVLREKTPVEEADGELNLYFEYRPHANNQKTLNERALERVFDDVALDGWENALRVPMPSQGNPQRTTLEKQLDDYTAKNSFDYFIHKDLGRFLRRELDFYLKNEVLHIDDLDADNADRAVQYLAKLGVIKQIGHKIIAFLSQIEDFQKKLFEKKKFVVQTDYCLTLDNVPEDLYAEIAGCDDQYAEWERLFAISEIEANLENGSVDQRNEEWLKAHPYLVLDTKFFGVDFKHQLLASIENLDERTNGLLIKSENFQALNLLQERYHEQVKCIYIDPPYNTGSSSILYKNNYRHSSWLTLMYDRLVALKPTLTMDGAIFVSIDKVERTVLEHAMDSVFGAENRVEELIWAMNTNNSQAPNYSTNHEYVEVYARDRSIAEQDRNMFREPKPGFEDVMALVEELNASYPPISVIESEIRALYERHKIEYREEIEAQGLEWENEKGNDPWKGLFNYSRAEYRDAGGNLVPESEAEDRQAQIWVWQEGDASMPATKQAASTYDPSSPNWRFYKPLHPATGKPCPHPKSGWKFAYADDEDSPGKRSFVALDRDGRIAWGSDENKVPRLKRMLHEVETNVGKSVFQDYSDGEKQTSAMFGRSGIFLAPKHADFVSRFILHAAPSDGTILACFGGSGSTGHAVINLNRQDRGSRKYILVEMGEYFDTVLKPRIQKAIYSKDWRNGNPFSRQGTSHVFKYMKLESYEDTLNNVALSRNALQQELVESDGAVREEYMLSYMLDNEASSSPSLLNSEAFEKPFGYKLKVSDSNETRLVNVDMVETFNYLLGLTIERVGFEEGFRMVEGQNPQGERVLVIWRDLGEQSNTDLDEFFARQGYGSRAEGEALDLVYVNGDNNLENLKGKGERWRTLLIEEEFRRSMFGGGGDFGSLVGAS